MDTVSFSSLKQEHLQDAAKVITNSFLQLNDIWKTMAPSYQDVFPVIRGNVIVSLKGGWSFVMLKGEKLIGCSINLDLFDYLTMPQMPTDLDLFRKIRQTGKNLDRQLDLSHFKPGEVCYGSLGGIDPLQAGNQAATRFWWYQVAMGKLGGWKYFFSRVSSPISLKLLERLGGKVIAETNVVGSEGKQRMWMVMIDLRQPLFTFSQMKERLSKGKGLRAKL